MTGAPGQIITFYSYKGGTGRSMALANVACLVASGAVTDPVQKPVLMIDWDLEAPGLPRYFNDYLPSSSASSPGVIDLFEDLEQRLRSLGLKEGDDTESAVAEVVKAFDWSRYIVATQLPKLSLMAAGRADKAYPGRVNRFDWEALFSLAPSLMTTLAERLSDEFSFVFIDSRTGHTDIKEICTTLLPDKLVLVFTPNQQSIQGAIDVGRMAVQYRMTSDDLRPLGVFPLASRVEAQMEDLRKLWRRGDPKRGIQGFQPAFQEFFRRAYRPEPLTEKAPAPSVADADAAIKLALEHYFHEVQIQQSPTLAYGEPIAALSSGGDRFSISRSYQAFAQRLVTTAGPWEEGSPVNRELEQRILANQSDREAAEAKQAYAEQRSNALRKQLTQGLVAVGALAAVLGAYQVYTAVNASKTELESTLAAQLIENARLKREERGTGAQLTKAKNRLDFVREQNELLSQIEQAAVSARSLGEFTFPSRQAATKPTDELKSRCQEAIEEFDAIKDAVAKAQQNLETIVSEPGDGKSQAQQAPDNDVQKTCVDEVCVELRSLVVSLARRTLAELRESSQVMLPSLSADRDFWFDKATSWENGNDKGAREEALAVWQSGYDLYLKGNHAAAREKYVAAKSMDPTWAPPYNSLAVLEMGQGNFASALGLIEEALVRDNGYAPAYSNRALIYLNLATAQSPGTDAWKGMVRRSEEAADRALQLRPGFSSPLATQKRLKSLKTSAVELQQTQAPLKRAP